MITVDISMNYTQLFRCKKYLPLSSLVLDLSISLDLFHQIELKNMIHYI